MFANEVPYLHAEGRHYSCTVPRDHSRMAVFLTRQKGKHRVSDRN